MDQKAPRSVYRSPEAEASLMAAYDSLLSEWPVSYSTTDVSTRYGSVHVIVSGPDDGVPVLLFHAASMASVSWAPNVGALVDAGFRTFAVDYIGEAGRSTLDDIDNFPQTPDEIGGLGTEIADRLGIDVGPVIGASAGGHAAMRYALENPGRVSKLVLLGPMGITPLGLGAMLRMMLVSMLPSDRRIEGTNRWALGEASKVAKPYRNWFSTVLRGIGSPPRVGRPKALNGDEMSALDMPVLLVLGDADKLVGDPSRAAGRAGSFPDIRIDIVHSGHLVGVERADVVNQSIVEFLTREEA
jgi:pimeloyl-ACP methyl ester carboxylesterase